MFNAPYFAHLAKSNLKFLAAFTLVLCLFLTVMANVFTPETVTDLQSAARGTIASQILTGNGTLIGFMANSFYRYFIIFILKIQQNPLICIEFFVLFVHLAGRQDYPIHSDSPFSSSCM